jgi:hypothetical protein
MGKISSTGKRRPQRNEKAPKERTLPRTAKQLTTREITVAAQLCKHGATIGDLAEYFEVTRRTINMWFLTDERFRDVVKPAQAEADTRVKFALFERAKGYSYETEKIDKDGNIVKLTEHMPPDFNSIKLWLTSRCKDEFLPKADDDSDGTLKIIIEGGLPIK